MTFIGFHFNRSMTDGRLRPLSPSTINRVALIDSRLRTAGTRLFIYSPADVLQEGATVPGFLFEKGEFVPTEAPIPRVNGNWTHRTRRRLERGMGYLEFGRWAAERGIGIYVPQAFSELLVDKLESYKIVRAFHETLHPLCERYSHTARQLEYFVDTGPVTFIKPRAGSKGNRIVTLRRDGTGLTVTRYRDGRKRRFRAATVSEAMAFIGEVRKRKRRYVIQHGVETLRHEGAVFDIRVTMMHDGSTWRWVHEARLARSGSDVSNVAQGGAVTITEELLFEVMGAEASREMLRMLESESFGLAAHLEALHPGDILELAFDFAIDRQGRLRLLEVNTKPGVPGIGSDVTVYDKRIEHEPLFRRWVYPHASCLADFLLRKAGLRPEYPEASGGPQHMELGAKAEART